MNTSRTITLLSLGTMYALHTACASEGTRSPAPSSSATDVSLGHSSEVPSSNVETASIATTSATSQSTATHSGTASTLTTTAPSSTATNGNATSLGSSASSNSSSAETVTAMTSNSSSDSTTVVETTSEVGDSTSSDTGPSQLGSPGCTASSVKSGNVNLTVDVDGTSRSFILHVPTSYDGSAPVPFILDLHPLGGSGSQEQQSSGYQRIADDEGLIIAFPDGIDNAWNVGPCCTNSRDVDDVAFARAIVDSVAAQACIDLKRVYAVGFSMGGGMSHYLACQATDVFAAVAPAAFDLLVPEEQTCEPSRPVSVLTFRGTQDTTSPFNGGPGPSGRATFEGAYGSFERWREMNGCNEVNTVEGDCTTYTECSDGVEVALCVKDGGGHATGDANVGWAFLKRFVLP